MIKEFKGRKYFQTELGDVPVSVGYEYSDTWEDYTIEIVMSEKGEDLTSLLDVVTDETYIGLMDEIYKLENE